MTTQSVPQHIASLESVISGLEQILGEVRAGHTLRQCLNQSLPSERVSATQARQWTIIRDGILSGQVSAERSLQGFIRILKNQLKIIRLIHRRSYMPRVQGMVLAGFYTLMGIVVTVLSEKPPPLPVIVFVGGWISLGILTLKYLIQKTFQDSWISHWIIFLRMIELLMSWGSTFASAIRAQAPSIQTQLPAALFIEMSKITELASSAQTPNGGLDKTIKRSSQKKKSFYQRALTQWQQIVTLDQRGISITPLLQEHADQMEELLTMTLEDKGERLGIILLIPLFVFFVPPLFILLFASYFF